MTRALAQFGRDCILLTAGAAIFSAIYIALSLIFNHRWPW